MTERGFLLAFLVAVGIGLLASLLATPFGLGVTPDSVSYLHAADSLRQGAGYRVPAYDGSLVPLTHWPPLYPATIAMISALGLDVLAAARVVALVLGAANIAAVTLAAWMFTGSRGAAAVVAFTMALSVDMLFLNTAVWSEAQFILLEVVCLLSVTAYLQGRGQRYLVLGASAAALAWLGRYVGGSLAVTGILAMALLGAGRLRRRLLDAVLFGAIAGTPAVAWMARNAIITGTPTDRIFTLSMPSLDYIGAILQTIASWLLPGTNRAWLFASQDVVMAFGALVSLGTLLYAIRRWIWPTLDSRMALVRTPVVFVLFAVVYLASLFTVVSFVEGEIPMDNRLLVPIYVVALIVVAFVGHVVYRSARSRTARAGILVFVAAFLVVNAAVSVGVVTYFRKEGRGFAGPSWHYPALREELASIEPQAMVFSNHPAAVEFRLGRRAIALTPKAFVEAVASQGQAILVYFDNPRSYAPRHPRAAENIPSTPEYRVDLLRGFTATLLVNERNGWVYRAQTDRAGVKAP